MFNLLSATDKRRSTCRAYLLYLETIEDEHFSSPVAQHCISFERNACQWGCRSIKLTSLRDASEDFGIPNFGQLIRTHSKESRGHQVSRLIFGYDQNVLKDSECNKLQNGLLYYRQPFHNPTSVGRLALDCTVEYTNPYQGIMPEAHNIWVQYTHSEYNNLDNPSQGQIPCFSVLHFCSTPPYQILQFQGCLPARKTLSTISTRCKNTQQWVLCPQAQEYAVIIPTKCKDLHGWANCLDGFIQVVKQMNKMHIVPIGACIGPANLVQESAESGGIDSIWLVNNHVYLETYWTVY